MKKRFITTLLCIILAMLTFSYLVVVVEAAGEGTVEVSVEADKLSYRYQESVNLTISAQNISGNPANLQFDIDCPARFTIDGSEAFPRNCTSGQNALTVGANESQEWNHTINPGADDYPLLHPGEHTITAYLDGYDAIAETTFNVGFATEGEGSFCGGITSLDCEAGMKCQLSGPYEGASGYCTNEENYDNGSSFQDVTDNHWAKQYIENLVQKGVLSGYSDGTFRPDNPVTRAELVKMALSAADIEPTSGQPDVNCDRYDGSYCTGLFNDLDEWQKEWVFKAQELEIVDGYDEYTFAPNANVSRAEALKIILLAFEVNYVELYAARDIVTVGFSDVNYNKDWFGDYVAYAVSEELVQGYPNGSFGPDQNMTRAEASKLLDLLM